MSNPNPELTIRLNVDQINLVMKYLVKGPMEEVFTTWSAVRDQANAEVQRINQELSSFEQPARAEPAEDLKDEAPAAAEA